MSSLQLQNGIIRDWLVIGPFAVKDSVRDFNEVQLADQGASKPATIRKARLFSFGSRSRRP